MNKWFCFFALLCTCISGLATDSNLPTPDIAFFTKLRMGYSQRKDFSPLWKMEDEREAVLAAYKAKDFKKAFDLGEHWLTRCPVDADVHTVCSSAATALGDIKSYFHHLYFAYGLMQSVTQSGNGLAPKTAFKVISVAEEYSVLREFGADVVQQTLIDGPCDKMDCKFPGGKNVTLYFDVSIPIKAESK